MPEHPGGLHLALTCVLAATPERVFHLLTDPVELGRWWGPHGFTTVVTRLDLVVGGGYRFTMQPPDGDPFHLSGEFLEIDRPSRLVYTFRWEEPTPDDRETVAALSLTPLDDTTGLSLSQGSFATEERLELHRDGWTDSLERLRRVVDEPVTDR